MIQILMDGPSANWKLFKLIQKDREEKERTKLLDIGSRIVHIIMEHSNLERRKWLGYKVNI